MREDISQKQWTQGLKEVSIYFRKCIYIFVVLPY